MTLHRKLIMIWLFCLSILSSASQAYVLQAPKQDTSESRVLAPFASQEAREIQWATIEPKSSSEFFHESFQTQNSHFVALPNNVGLANEFHEMGHRHSVINTDQSRRFNAPEPSAWIMMSLGLFGLILARRRNRR